MCCPNFSLFFLLFIIRLTLSQCENDPATESLDRKWPR